MPDRRSRLVLSVVALLCAAPALPSPAPTRAPARPVLTAAVDPGVGGGAGPARPVEAPGGEDTASAAHARSSPEAPRWRPVTAQRVALRLDGAPPDAADRVADVVGVSHAATVRVGRMTAGSDHQLVVAAVDPVAYRPFAPQVVVDEVGVWERLAEGAVAVTHEHARRLGLALGGQVRLGGAGGVDVRVGAFASNGVPPVGEALVSDALASRLGLDVVAPTLLVGVDEGADPTEVADRVADRLGVAPEVVPDPRAPSPVAPAPPRGDTVWDVLAACESSGDWHANTGNGFYGGLQFLPESWWLVGGSGMPHEATREEQIARAERLLALQGWVAWPVCSIRVGLRPDPAAG